MLVLACSLQVLTLGAPTSAGMVVETTFWVSTSGSHSKLQDLAENEKWVVGWEVLQGGNGRVDVLISTEAEDVTYLDDDYTSSNSYTLDPGVAGSYQAKFTNPYSEDKQVKVTTQVTAAVDIPGYDGIIVIGLISLVTLLMVRRVLLGKKSHDQE